MSMCTPGRLDMPEGVQPACPPLEELPPPAPVVTPGPQPVVAASVQRMSEAVPRARRRSIMGRGCPLREARATVEVDPRGRSRDGAEVPGDRRGGRDDN